MGLQDYVSTQQEVLRLREALQASEEAVKDGTAWAGELIERIEESEAKVEAHDKGPEKGAAGGKAGAGELEAALREAAGLREALEQERREKAQLEVRSSRFPPR